MTTPLRPTGQRANAGQSPDQGRPPTTDEIVNRLARKIADEEDDRARQRFDEIWNPQKYWSADKKRNLNIATIVCLAVMALILWVAFHAA